MEKELKEGKPTITLNHKRFDDIVADQLKVGVSNPVADGRLRTREKIVNDGDFVPQEHETVHKMGTDEAGASCYQNAFPRRWGEKSHRRESREGGVRNRVRVRMKNGL